MRNSKEWFRPDEEDLGKFRTKTLGSRKQEFDYRKKYRQARDG